MDRLRWAMRIVPDVSTRNVPGIWRKLPPASPRCRVSEWRLALTKGAATFGPKICVKRAFLRPYAR